HKVTSMCDCQSSGRVTRRQAIAAATAVGAAVAVGAGGSTVARAAPVGPAVPAVEILPGLSIYPRDAWGANLPPVGPIATETPPPFLVHHTPSPNTYPRALNSTH